AVQIDMPVRLSRLVGEAAGILQPRLEAGAVENVEVDSGHGCRWVCSVRLRLRGRTYRRLGICVSPISVGRSQTRSKYIPVARDSPAWLSTVCDRRYRARLACSRVSICPDCSVQPQL